MKKLKQKIFQSFADFIINRLKDAPNEKTFNLWYNIGVDFNLWCVEKDFYLN